MRAGLWLLESGETPPREIALSGARAALRSFDPALARRLAESALSHGSSQEGLVLLGRAYAAAGEAPKAMSVLQDAQERAAGDSELAAAAVALAEVLMFNIGDAQRAVRELEKAAEALLDPGARAEVNSHLMLAVGIIGDFDLGLRIGPQVADQLDLPEPAQLTSVMAMTLTQTMTGQLDLVMERLDRGEALAGRLSDVQPLAADQIGMNRLLAHHARGEFVMAEARARKSLQSGVGLPGPWLFVQAMGRLFTGDVVGGRQLCAEAGAQLADIDPLGVEPQAHGIRALFESMAGNRETAESLADLVRKDPRGAPTRSAVWVDRADAWNLAAGGEPERAADLAVNAGEAAVAGTHYVWGAFAHHDAVRFGHPAKAVEPLRALAEEGRGPLVRLLADHAIAASAGDREALLGVAQRCLQSGALALVSECHAAAAMLTTGVEQRRHAHLAWLYHDRCIGFRSPLVQLVDPTLSRRQLEIASLAAAGHSSKDIARQLHISARTVDNHLRTVFRLFGIDSRTALAELFPS
jgi:DNA-binding CsgD family transcriptional regulator/tetratricopeptide (TPR) repeat protein